LGSQTIKNVRHFVRKRNDRSSKSKEDTVLGVRSSLQKSYISQKKAARNFNVLLKNRIFDKLATIQSG